MFHSVTDTGVQYSGEEVIVDGSVAEIKIDSNKIVATPVFMYLPVRLDSANCISTHFTNKLAALNRAAHLLATCLSRVPAYPHCFFLYLWTSLVVPICGYGMEVHSFPDALVVAARANERKWWRRLLQVGGRAPNASVQVLC